MSEILCVFCRTHKHERSLDRSQNLLLLSTQTYIKTFVDRELSNIIFFSLQGNLNIHSFIVIIGLIIFYFVFQIFSCRGRVGKEEKIDELEKQELPSCH